MRFTRIQFYLFGIFCFFAVYFIDHGWFLLHAKHATGTCVGTEQYEDYSVNGKYRLGSTHTAFKPVISFDYEGHSYTFSPKRFSAVGTSNTTEIIFNPDNPTNAYQYSFYGFWRWGLIIIAIIFVPWSAAALSFVGKDEVLIISLGKVRLENKSGERQEPAYK